MVREIDQDVLDKLITMLERGVMKTAYSTSPEVKDLLRLSMQVLMAERAIEERIRKAKGDEKKRLKEAMKRVKMIRERLIRLYTAHLLKRTKSPWLVEVTPWR